MTWRLIYVSPAAERKIASYIADRVRGPKPDAYVPIERVWRGHAHRRRQHERPLIARYVFVDLEDWQIPEVARLDGFIRFIGDASGPYALTPRGRTLLQAIRRAEADGAYDQTVKVEPVWDVGSPGRIARGQFKGMAVTIASMDFERRARVITSLFGHTGIMSVDLDDLEPEVQQVAA